MESVNKVAVATGSGVFMMLIYMLYLGIFAISIYVVVLFIKLANRGIKALDIYIAKNRN